MYPVPNVSHCLRYNSLKVEDVHIPFPIVVFESNTVCLVKVKSIHGYQRVGISKGGLCIFHAMKDSAPNTKRKIINMR